MKRGQQLAFLPGMSAQVRGKERFFGGRYLGKSSRSHAKRVRPLDTKLPIHLVMRSAQAKGKQSLLLKARLIEELLKSLAARNGVEVLDFANVGNHLHVILRIRSRRLYIRFIRAFSASVSRLISGAHKYNKIAARFWDQRPFTRVLASAGKPLRLLQRYLRKNKLEALGFSSVSARTVLALGLDIKILAAPS